jgi:hypothetical protein
MKIIENIEERGYCLIRSDDLYFGRFVPRSGEAYLSVLIPCPQVGGCAFLCSIISSTHSLTLKIYSIGFPELLLRTFKL